MICFPLKFKPIYIDNKELMRIGSIYDGGYVVPYKAIIETSKLISFGINDNWDFEKDFSKISLANIIAYDHSIDSNFWKKRFKNDLIKILKLKIFKLSKILKMFKFLDFLYFFKLNKKNKFFLNKIGINSGCISLNEVIDNIYDINDKLFLKIDIEGSEYEIVDEIIENKEKFIGIVIEFHKTTEFLDKIFNFIDLLKPNLLLVHIHANNYSVKKNGQFPEAIEFTFAKADLFSSNLLLSNNKKYPIENLDFPNLKRSKDVDICFG